MKLKVAPRQSFENVTSTDRDMAGLHLYVKVEFDYYFQDAWHHARVAVTPKESCAILDGTDVTASSTDIKYTALCLLRDQYRSAAKPKRAPRRISF